MPDLLHYLYYTDHHWVLVLIVGVVQFAFDAYCVLTGRFDALLALRDLRDEGRVDA